jgi:hypothetical protein
MMHYEAMWNIMIASERSPAHECAVPKKPVSLRMHADVHAAAKRRAKDLGMPSLAHYIEALVGHDTAKGFDLVVTYRAGEKPRHEAVIPRRGTAKKKSTRRLSTKGVLPGRRASKQSKRRARATDAPN